MKIATEACITNAVVKALREDAGMYQNKFWAAIGIGPASGCRYEEGQRIPRNVRILIYLRYVAGIPFDVSTEEGARAAIKLGQAAQMQRAEAMAGASINQAVQQPKEKA